MNYSLYLLGLFVILLIIYVVIRVRESNLPVVKLETFGPKSSKFQINKKHNDRIIEQKIVHKNIAFYIYVFSLIVSLAFGCYAAFKIIQHIDVKLWPDVLPIPGGIIFTFSFRKLHDKCEKDLNNL